VHIAFTLFSRIDTWSINGFIFQLQSTLCLLAVIPI
jgi:hypothetical protein